MFEQEILEDGDYSYWTNYGREIANAYTEGRDPPIADKNKKKEQNYNSSRKKREDMPDCIIHVNDESINKIATIEGLTSFLNLTEDEAALLSFYASCSTGFKPCLKVTAEKTGFNERQICRVKNRLIEKRVIEWQGVWNQICQDNKYRADEKQQNSKYNSRIIIDWQKLGAVAFAGFVAPEMNDRHLYYKDGKRVRQNIKKHLGEFENQLLWDNKPASYWADLAIKIRRNRES